MISLLYGQVRIGDRLPVLGFDISTTGVVAGAIASRDYSPLHHDFPHVTQRAGHRNIFLNTPHQAAFLERFLGDWSGSRGRLGRMRFKMIASVYAGDRISITGEVIDMKIDEKNCGWIILNLQIGVGDTLATDCRARYALPLSERDNPWCRRAEEWQP